MNSHLAIISIKVLSVLFVISAHVLTPTFTSGQTVQYELVEGSELGYSFLDAEGNVNSTFANLRGTFRVTFLQKEVIIVGIPRQQIEGDLRDVSFQSISGPSYDISGQGYYSLISNASSPTGFPAQGGMELGLRINGKNVGFTTEFTKFQTFPLIDAGLIQSDFPPHGYGVRLVAQPSGDDAKRFFRRADVNGDGVRNITDAILILQGLFKGNGEFSCEDAADSNDDGRIDLSDCVTILKHLFEGQKSLSIPATLCGLDPTDDTLVCGGSNTCMASVE